MAAITVSKSFPSKGLQAAEAELLQLWEEPLGYGIWSTKAFNGEFGDAYIAYVCLYFV